MSNNGNNKKPPPSFSGNTMSNNVSLTMENSLTTDDGDDEVTRRVAAMPSFQPSFGPMSSFEPPSLSKFDSSAVLTAPSKAGNITSPLVSTSAAKQVRSKGVWQLREVPPLPEYHPLERTACFVPHQRSPADIACRISEILRDRSIEACYEDGKAKVKCVTPDGVDFRIRLYRGRGNYCHGVIVEVQRRFGTSVNFYNDVNAILRAAEGKMVPPPPPGSSSASLPYVSDSEGEDNQPSPPSSLTMVAKMLSHPGYDSRYLAFQTLSTLTDASKMGASTSRKVSKELLQCDNEVGGKVLALVLDKKEEDDVFKARVVALTVLANAIEAVGGNIEDELREQLRPALLGELSKDQIESNPRAAQMACRCLEHLIQGDHNASGLYEGLESALEVGTARHAGLQRQAQRCLDKINGGSRSR